MGRQFGSQIPTLETTMAGNQRTKDQVTCIMTSAAECTYEGTACARKGTTPTCLEAIQFESFNGFLII